MRKRVARHPLKKETFNCEQYLTHMMGHYLCAGANWHATKVSQ
jgi:hypothetical protein